MTIRWRPFGPLPEPCDWLMGLMKSIYAPWPNCNGTQYTMHSTPLHSIGRLSTAILFYTLQKKKYTHSYFIQTALKYFISCVFDNTHLHNNTS